MIIKYVCQLNKMQLTATICPGEHCLDDTIHTYLLNYLRTRLEGTCSLQRGCIVRVHSLDEIVDAWVSRANGRSMFSVKYTADVFKPVPGERHSGEICMIFEHGLLVTLPSHTKTLIPSASLVACGFEWDGTAFVRNETRLVVGQRVRMVIKHAQFVEDHFNCVCDWVDA